ncbi:MAG: hypothetical protein UR12_C0007G0022 [candidate division TM6 bacterium GW2011_GWF2_30_66]|nr:MAG: hypothetical protein UR12_C0007G0022 [candidate division TM6 bacterium GW2011_GWF2_30_66]
MFFYVLMKGLFLGFTISAIIGPIGILCIKRSISEGFWAGVSTGVGAALADAIYAAITAFGITVISNFLLGKAFVLSLFGGIYLIYMGIRTFMSRSKLSSGSLKNSELDKDVTHYSLFHNFISTFFITLTNPVTILLFMVIFAGLNLETEDMLSSSSLVTGVFFGAVIWWIFLSYVASILKSKLTSGNLLLWLNRISGVVIICFGVLIILRAFIKSSFIKIL